MASEDVAKALVAMNEEAVRTSVLQGDSGALGTLDLTAQERELVRAAADEWAPEVAGFDAKSGLASALAYAGDGGVTAETAVALDEVVSDVLGFGLIAEPTPKGCSKCSKCNKTLLSFNLGQILAGNAGNVGTAVGRIPNLSQRGF